MAISYYLTWEFLEKIYNKSNNTGLSGLPTYIQKNIYGSC